MRLLPLNPLIPTILLLPATIALAGDRTLGDLCGPEGSTFGPAAGQMENVCRAAYAAGNARFVQDNNARVRASVAISAVGPCLMGSSGACSTAVENGHLASKNNRAGNESERSAQGNGQRAWVLASQSTVVGGVKPIPPPAGQKIESPGYPSECQRAVSSGLATDRIACAAATDPSLPDYVKSPQFVADFQENTGYALQDVINKAPTELMRDYAEPAMEHLYAKVKDKMTMAEFLEKRNTLINSVVAKIREDRGASPGGSPAVAGPLIPPSDGSASPENLMSGLGDLARTSAGAQQARFLTRPEEDRDLSLFVRVSNRYRLIATRELNAPAPAATPSLKGF